MSHNELISIGRRSDFFPMKIPQSRRSTQDDLAKLLTPCEKIVSFSRRISLLFNIPNKFTGNRRSGHGLRNPQNAIKKLNLKASKMIKAHNSSSQLWFHYRTNLAKYTNRAGKLNNKNIKKPKSNSQLQFIGSHTREPHTNPIDNFPLIMRADKVGFAFAACLLAARSSPLSIQIEKCVERSGSIWWSAALGGQLR